MHHRIIRVLEKRDIFDVGKIYDQYWSGSFREKLSRKFDEFITASEKAVAENVYYFVVEEREAIVGAISFRSCPDPMLTYSKTAYPFEIYILAVKDQGKGIGKILLEKAFEEAKMEGYTEALLFNSDSHQESRGFYARLRFEDAGVATAPDGELGHVFRKVLK